MFPLFCQLMTGGNVHQVLKICYYIWMPNVHVRMVRYILMKDKFTFLVCAPVFIRHRAVREINQETLAWYVDYKTENKSEIWSHDDSEYCDEFQSLEQDK
jgi:hypothetical protein